MKPTCVRLLATITLALAASLATAQPVLAEPSARGAATPEIKCRTQMAAASRRYLERVLLARMRCEDAILDGRLSPSTNCRTGNGDAVLTKALNTALDKLTNSGSACQGVDFFDLAFPGKCPDTTGGRFTTLDLQKCIQLYTGIINTELLDYYYPPFTDFLRGNESKCMKGSALDAAKSLLRVIRARERCLLGQELGLVSDEVDCRAEIQPYGPGTGDAQVDRAISRGYVKLLGAIPLVCVNIQVDDLDYQSSCIDTTGGAFTIYDLKNCFFHLDNAAALSELGIVFPTEPVCGDGIIAGEEECDDGLDGNSDTTPNACRTDCKNPVCHDGVTDNQFNEQCDDGNVINTDCCVGECVNATCGDGSKNCGEECDLGAGNANVADTCRKTGPYACKNPTCGDGIEDSVEQCDDGNTASNDGCSSACFDEFCGDDVVQGPLGEECDNGSDNANAPDTCRATGEFACKNPKCLDGITDPGNNETCDDGNTNNADACRNNCTFCGDGNENAGEECDDGVENSNAPDKCRLDCKDPRCGDGIPDPGNNETCDDGNTNDSDSCRNDCAFCGDGEKSGTEECDDGVDNSNAPNKCRLDCKLPRCGDTIIDPAINESCDDGNSNNNDSCRNTCDVCGDGIESVLDECDDGVDNSNAPDKCRLDCKLPKCGDSITDPGILETCDDGNDNNDDSCANTCATCGDGIKAPLEICDGGDEVCPGGEACNDLCGCEAVCPTVGSLTLYASYGKTCTDNSDCAVGSCDLESGYCRTSTRLDSGWTGAGHASDINDASTTRGFLQCDGHGPVCGQCNVIGVDPSTRSCRCSNNTRTICDEPFSENAADCPSCAGGAGVEGQACEVNGDCVAGPCRARCVANLANCTTNADCPGDVCSAGDAVNPTYCSNGTFCSANSDCTGTCTGQAGCDCYFGAPFPLNSGGTPACVVNRFAKNVTGTANVDLGAGEIFATLRTRVYLGPSASVPCSTCGGRCTNNNNVLCTRDLDCNGGTCTLDPVFDDGLRGGTCVGGDDQGLPCDVTGVNSAFPAFPEGPSGGGYSLDCLPGTLTNISGQGLLINLTQTTGTQSLSSNVSCRGVFPDLLCPCLLCTGGDSSNPLSCNKDSDCVEQVGTCSLLASEQCLSNTDCAAVNIGPCVQVGMTATKRCTRRASVVCTNDPTVCDAAPVGPCNPSTCSSFGIGVGPRPNKCNDGLCSDLGGGIGQCTTGPDTLYCDGVVRPDGNGVWGCQIDEDCQPIAIGIDAGNCTLLVRNGCFFDPLVATGTPNPSTPIGASAFCIPPVSNPGINGVAGLPGPGRVVNQAVSKTFCGNDTTKQYIPGVGGCAD